MSDTSPMGELPSDGLDRLLEALARDGWLAGLEAGVDPALARMDPQSGVFNGAHFKSLVQMAVDDAQSGRDRLFDGPEQGNVALLSVRMLGWEEITEQGPEPARAMARKVAEGLFAVLRAEDVLGRTREDTFTLLLRGCPMTVLGSIARRCVEVVENCAVSSDGEELTVRATSCVVSRTDEGVEDLLAATFRALN